jgi:hypothetical protein
MDHPLPPDGADDAVLSHLATLTDRRRFLKWSGVAVGVALAAACDRSPTEPGDPSASLAAGTANASGSVTINLGTDVGILNFAYALEQLEAAFYTKAVQSLYAGADAEEARILADIRHHEVLHREFFRAALGSAAIPNLAVDFSKVNFGSRNSVLATAQTFEDTGVGAYNGAAQFLRNGDYLVVAGKIVSVEARHAAAIRDILGRNFAPSAFDAALTFEQVLNRAGPFIATHLTITHSPTAGSSAQLTAGDEEMDS